MDKPGRVGGNSQGVLFFFFFVWPSLCLYLFSIHLLPFWSNHVPSLFFSPPQFFPIILLCGKQNLSEGRSIMLRCNSVAGYVQRGEWETGGWKIAFNGDVLLLRLERYIPARPSCVEGIYASGV